jgi:hypothetical protein
MAAKKLPTTSKSSSAATGKSKVISSSTPSGVRGGKGKMFGKQSVSAAKAK